MLLALHALLTTSSTSLKTVSVSDPDDDVGMAEPVVADRMAIIGEYEDDIGGDFAALDAELAAEKPDGPAEPKRRMFRRRAKGTTAAQR